jgi:hypothetical protein
MALLEHVERVVGEKLAEPARHRPEVVGVAATRAGRWRRRLDPRGELQLDEASHQLILRQLPGAIELRLHAQLALAASFVSKPGRLEQGDAEQAIRMAGREGRRNRAPPE